jgi:hypothetical protein
MLLFGGVIAYHQWTMQPDIAKIRRHRVEWCPVLAPHLEKIGSPSRQTIRQLLSNGEIPLEIFRGAFLKIQKSILDEEVF